MGRYLFRLVKLHTNAVRNTALTPAVDQDAIIFLIEVGTKHFGPLKNDGWWLNYAGSDWDMKRIDTKGANRGVWEIGPIEVADDDVVSIDYSVINVLDSIGRARSQHENPSDTVSQVTAGAEAVLLGAASAASEGFVEVVLAVGAGLASLFAGIFKGTPNCDGVVGGNKTSFTGAELRRATDNPQQAFSVTEVTGNTTKPDGCGSSEIVMTYSYTSENHPEPPSYQGLRSFC